eukprot:GHVU01166792.1.p1 GENE.GHVU01166792.1~~GHVU01166792.1.p1  ORF type:complete len:164 (+),score=10.72 GHVU01166792.1:980-1471(+)
MRIVEHIHVFIFLFCFCFRLCYCSFCPAPKLPPREVTFTDRNTEKGIISGAIIVTAAESPDEIAEYHVYLGTTTNDKAVQVAELPATGAERLTFNLASTGLREYTRICATSMHKSGAQHPQTVCCDVTDLGGKKMLQSIHPLRGAAPPAWQMTTLLWSRDATA